MHIHNCCNQCIPHFLFHRYFIHGIDMYLTTINTMPVFSVVCKRKKNCKGLACKIFFTNGFLKANFLHINGICVCVCACLFMYVCIYVFVCVCIYMCLCICVYVRMYVCVCVHKTTSINLIQVALHIWSTPRLYIYNGHKLKGWEEKDGRNLE